MQGVRIKGDTTKMGHDSPPGMIRLLIVKEDEIIVLHHRLALFDDLIRHRLVFFSHLVKQRGSENLQLTIQAERKGTWAGRYLGREGREQAQGETLTSPQLIVADFPNWVGCCPMSSTVLVCASL
jgi:hypothetical protein